MICELCKIKEADEHIENVSGTLDICFDCLFELQTGLGYYIAGNEVVKEEFDERTQTS
jgi:hypothetical protein